MDRYNCKSLKKIYLSENYYGYKKLYNKEQISLFEKIS